MPRLAKKNECCGCAACYSICEFAAIEIKPDETGFLYPIINTEKCKNCNMCERSCPVISPLKTKNEVNSYTKAFIIQHKNEYVRKQSTSGGAFSAIAEAIISLGGVVFGASMEEGFIVKHTYSETLDNLSKFRNSKYVQSEIGESYKQCKEFLLEGRWACFSGTPCQINGLLKYLNKKYDRLITIDIVCHSVPSPLIFRKYMELQQKKYPNAERIVFRDKELGYSYSTMAIYDKNSVCLYRRGSESDLWFRSFLPGLCDRENCYCCTFQEYPRISDITIWDCFAVKDIHPEYDDNLGTTSAISWSKKGFDLIVKNDSIRIKEVPINLFIQKIKREHNIKLDINRKEMYIDARLLSADQFFKKYRNESIIIKLRRISRELLFKSGFYNFVKSHIK